MAVTFFAEFFAWMIARRRYEGLIVGSATNFLVALEQSIAVIVVLVMVEAPNLSCRAIIGAVSIVAAVLGWMSGSKQKADK